jgi:hypothetical protein
MIPPTFLKRQHVDIHTCVCEEIIVSGRPDSNWRPSPWQGDALPTEPLPHVFIQTGRDEVLVAGAGFEPATCGLWARRAA